MQQYRNWQPQEPEHHYDMRALVFGVVSFLFCQLPVLSIVTGIIALVYAARAKKRQRCYSHGMVTAGMILGIIGALSEGGIAGPGGFGIAIIFALIRDSSIKKKVKILESDS